MGMYQRMNKLTWIADSRSNANSFPAAVQDEIGYALYGMRAESLDLRDPCLSEEVEGRDRDTEVRDGTDQAAAQTVAQ